MRSTGFEVDLRDLLDALPVMIAVIDREQRYVFVNRPYELLHGCPRAEIEGRPLREKLGEEGYLGIRREVERALAGERVRFDVSFPDPGGNGEQTFSTKYVPKRGAGGEVVGFYSLSSNVTPRKRAEQEREQLREKMETLQRLESLAALAGGVAHDFNNLLAAILGSVELARDLLSPEHPVAEELGQVEAAARRASELSRLMLAYSGKGRFRAETLDLSALARETAGFLRSDWSEGVRLELETRDDLAPVTVDPSQIRQVVTSLLTNAAEALEGAGCVTLRTGQVTLGREELAATYVDDDLPAGRYVYLEVADDGVGMDEETRRRLFDPFFTTKFAGRGLGLAAALGVVRAHRGAVSVESRAGEGSCIRVLLPGGEAPVGAAVVPPRSRPGGRAGHVLLVDDEACVRRVASRILERAGYQVTMAEGGREAVDLFAKDPARFVAVVLDLTMPGMDGAETLRELRRVASDIPVILCSGYGEDLMRERFGSPTLAAVVEKPFSVRSLLDAVQSVLG